MNLIDENQKLKLENEFLKKKGFGEEYINKMVSTFRFKKSKGSKYSVIMPLIYDSKLLKLAKFVRIRNGSISFSKSYIESYNEDFNEILKMTERMFDIKPKYTCKNEPLFCSGVLVDLFRNIIRK